MPQNNTLVKAAARTHNTTMNKLRFSSLQLVTSKAVTIPELIMGNVAMEVMSDLEALQRTKKMCQIEPERYKIKILALFKS